MGDDTDGGGSPQVSPNDEDIWADVYGHNAGKAVVSAALKQGDVHVLMEGPPGSGKSVFLLALEEKLPSGTARYRDGKQITASKLRDSLKDDPPILLIDEIDALDNDAYDVLTIPMEHGRLVRDSARESYDVKVGTQIIGSCNDADELPQHIQDRFRIVRFSEYTKTEYLDVCEHMLVRSDEVAWIQDKKTARNAARVILEETGEAKVRTARDICKMASSLEEIPTLSLAMDDPDAEVDVKPLLPQEIARAKDAVGKDRLEQVVLQDLFERRERKKELSEEMDDAIESKLAEQSA